MQGVVDEHAADGLIFVADRKNRDQRIVRAAGDASVAADAGFRAADHRIAGHLRREGFRLRFHDDRNDLFDEVVYIFHRLRDPFFEGFDIETPRSPRAGMRMDRADRDMIFRNAAGCIHLLPDDGDVLFREEQKVERNVRDFFLPVGQIHGRRIERIMRARVFSFVVRIAAEAEAKRRGDVGDRRTCFEHSVFLLYKHLTMRIASLQAGVERRRH